MGEGTGGGVDTDVGGAGQDVGSGRDTLMVCLLVRWAVGFQVLFPM